MLMIDAKKEIEDKLFQGAPLSFDAMMCALAAITSYIDTHGESSFVTLDIKVDDDDPAWKAANDMLMSELKKGFDSAEKQGWIDADDVRHLILDGNDFGG
jgi:hypothetical protein